MPGSVNSLGKKLPVPLLSSQCVGWGALSITEDCRVLLRASLPVDHVSGTGLRRERAGGHLSQNMLQCLKLYHFYLAPLA